MYFSENGKGKRSVSVGISEDIELINTKIIVGTIIAR